jgi:thiamine-monophosphate kinase
MHCLRAQLDPTPPVAVGRVLLEQELVRAGMDISDGLSSDLTRLCRASGVGARIQAELVPVDIHAMGLARAQGGEAFGMALHGGEDYQLLLAVPPERVEEVAEIARVWNIPITRIGEIREGSAVEIEDRGVVQPLAPAGYDHFRARA